MIRPGSRGPTPESGDRALDALLRRTDVWRGRAVLPSGSSTDDPSTGHPALDTRLGGGWPRGALVELLTDLQGIGEVSLLLPLLAAQSRAGRRVAFVAPPHTLYAPALDQAGVRLDRVLAIGAREDTEILWAMEQALGSGVCGAVLGWPSRPSVRALRRLQLAAERGHATGFLYRQARQSGQASPAAVRLRLSPAGEDIAVEVLKRRRGWGGASVVLPRPGTWPPATDMGRPTGRHERS